MGATSNGGSDLLTEFVVEVGDLVPPDVGGSLVVQCTPPLLQLQFIEKLQLQLPLFLVEISSADWGGRGE